MLLHRTLRFSLISLAVLSVGMASVASAQTIKRNNGLYVGAGLGGSSYSSDIPGQIDNAYPTNGFRLNDAQTTKDNDLAYQFLVGYRFLPWLSVESSFVDLGKAKTEYQVQKMGTIYNIDGKYRTYGITLAAIGELPIGDRFSVSAKGGALVAWQKYEENGGSNLGDSHDFSHTDTTTSPLFGLGATWHVTQQWDVRANWDRYFDIGKKFSFNDNTNGRFDHVDTYTVNVLYNF